MSLHVEILNSELQIQTLSSYELLWSAMLQRTVCTAVLLSAMLQRTVCTAVLLPAK
jgi:hypothetical protein